MWPAEPDKSHVEPVQEVRLPLKAHYSGSGMPKLTGKPSFCVIL